MEGITSYNEGMMEGKEIKELRTRLGWTQQHLGDYIGATHVSVYKWEKGLSKPMPVFANKLEELRDGEVPA